MSSEIYDLEFILKQLSCRSRNAIKSMSTKALNSSSNCNISEFNSLGVRRSINNIYDLKRAIKTCRILIAPNFGIKSFNEVKNILKKYKIAN